MEREPSVESIEITPLDKGFLEHYEANQFNWKDKLLVWLIVLFFFGVAITAVVSYLILFLFYMIIGDWLMVVAMLLVVAGIGSLIFI